ncbi:MAG: thiamine pyrophosphate-binding protein [Gammaproteobacteria bacterium]
MSSVLPADIENAAIVPAPVAEAGDLLVNYLAQIGVEYVFGVPGGAIEPLYNALARSARRGGPHPIVARHETGAAFMAEGYARETGRLGVCCATTGPGATNLITGVASAYQENIPLLVITAQAPITTFGRGPIQDSSCSGVNTVAMFQHCTRYSSLVSHVAQLEVKLVDAIVTACRTSHGPAHLSIPLDILRTPLPSAAPAYSLQELLHPANMMDRTAFEKLCVAIDEARRIVLVVGEGCREAVGDILEFALLKDACIVAMPQGKGLVNPYHPNFRGVFGFAGHASAVEALQDPRVDLVLAIGTNLDEFSTNGWDGNTLLNDRLIHIDSLERNFTRSPMARTHVAGRIRTVFEALLERYRSAPPMASLTPTLSPPGEERGRLDTPAQDAVPMERRGMERMGNLAAPPMLCLVAERGPDSLQVDGARLPARHFALQDEKKYLDDATPIKPQRLMYDLARLFPPDTRFVVDTGNSYIWAIHYLHPFDRRITGQRPSGGGAFRVNMGFSSMGWAIGAAVGTALGDKRRTVVCITGDGSFLMSGQEITVAVAEKLPVIFVVLNDAALGTAKHGQRLAGAEQVGIELPRVDFAAMARAMGADAYSIHSPRDMEALDIAAMCERHRPTLLDVYIDPKEVPPMGMRMKSLGMA